MRALFPLGFFFEGFANEFRYPLHSLRTEIINHHIVTRDALMCRETLLYFSYSRKRVCIHGRYVRKVYDQNI